MTLNFSMYAPNENGEMEFLGREVIEYGNLKKVLKSRDKWERKVKKQLDKEGDTYTIKEEETDKVIRRIIDTKSDCQLIFWIIK